MRSAFVDGEEEVAKLASRIRGLRVRFAWTLEELSARSGLSQPYLSRLEVGERQPSFSALVKLARAFAVSLADLFEPSAGERAPVVLRHGAVALRAGADGHRFAPLSPLGTSATLVPLRVLVASGVRDGERFAHDGEEWLYVQRGSVRLRVASEHYDLNSGDAAHFDARLQHGVTALGDGDAELIVVANFAPHESKEHLDAD